MSEPAAPARERRRPHRAAQPLSWLLVGLVLTQAALAGPAWFQRPSLFELHGWLGSATLVVAVVLALLALVGRTVAWVRVATLLLAVGSFAQIGLGYAGRRGGLAVASSVHVPLGVTLPGLAVAVAVAWQMLTRPNEEGHRVPGTA